MQLLEITIVKYSHIVSYVTITRNEFTLLKYKCTILKYKILLHISYCEMQSLF